MVNFTDLPIKTDIIVIGAGVAGAAIAGELQRQGKKVCVFEQHGQAAQETSANQMALAHPQLGTKISKLQRFTRCANAIARTQWAFAQSASSAFEPRFGIDIQEQAALQRHVCEMGFDDSSIQVLSKEQAKKQANIDAPGLLYTNAAIYSLPQICAQELQGIKTFWHMRVSKIKKDHDDWLVLDERDGIVGIAKAIVFANGLGVTPLLKTINCALVLRPVRGQISTFSIQHGSPLLPFLPSMPLRGVGYCAPIKRVSIDNWTWSVGSSFDEDVPEQAETLDAHRENAIRGLDMVGCDHSLIGELEVFQAYVGIRSASKDRLPLIGPIPAHPGLFCATAYGSRGVLWSALGQKLISAYLDAFFAGADRLRAGFLAGTSVADSAELVSSVTPARFFAGALATRASNSKPIFPVS